MNKCNYKCFAYIYPDCILTDQEAAKGYLEECRHKLSEEERKEKQRIAKRRSREKLGRN